MIECGTCKKEIPPPKKFCCNLCRYIAQRGVVRGKQQVRQPKGYTVHDMYREVYIDGVLGSRLYGITVEKINNSPCVLYDEFDGQIIVIGYKEPLA